MFDYKTADGRKPRLVVLAGPTAVGKTELSIALAKKLNADIISADSMQVYRHMDIGTAKIRPEEMQGVRHYLINELDPDAEFNVTVFQRLAYKYMSEIYENGRLPMIVGGTGFYIQSILYDIEFAKYNNDVSASDVLVINPDTLQEPDVDISYGPQDSGFRDFRAELVGLLNEKGAHCLHEKLRSVDPEYAASVHENNTKKVIRALEFYMQTGTPLSSHNSEQRSRMSPFDFVYLVLTDSRELIYERINKRVDKMFEDGLVNEVAELRKRGYGLQHISMQGLGYKEILEYLNVSCTLQEVAEIIKRDTRHFAKRQLTWFRREKEVIWLDRQAYASQDDLVSAALDLILHGFHDAADIQINPAG